MGNSVEKRTIAQFVHDAVEMETTLRIIDPILEDLILTRDSSVSATKEHLKIAEEIVAIWTEPETEDAVEQKPIVMDKENNEKNKRKLFFFKSGQKKNDTSKKEKDNYIQPQKEKRELPDCIKDYFLEVSMRDKLLEQARIKEKNAAIQVEEYTNIRNNIKKNLTVLLGYGIIPPDYRDYDCLIILDQIFRNDLADTMRDAIKIYEERVFRGSVIRGMDKICEKLDELSSDMSAISLRLDMIDSNVSRMSNDLYNYNQRLVAESEKNRVTTEGLIKETQLGRYTNEKLLESNKRLEYYAEEYRMGRMPIR